MGVAYGTSAPCLLKTDSRSGKGFSSHGKVSYFYDCTVTFSPTTAPVTAPPITAANQATAPAVAAVGDPHMQNILGQRFDLAQPGEHTLLQIPRGASASDALLRVTADAKHEGGACSDMYF